MVVDLPCPGSGLVTRTILEVVVEVDELEVGAQEAIGLGGGAARVVEDDELVGATLVLAELGHGGDHGQVGQGRRSPRRCAACTSSGLAHEGEPDADARGRRRRRGRRRASGLGLDGRARRLRRLADGEAAGDQRLEDLQLAAPLEQQPLRSVLPGVEASICSSSRLMASSSDCCCVSLRQATNSPANALARSAACRGVGAFGGHADDVGVGIGLGAGRPPSGWPAASFQPSASLARSARSPG